MTNRFLWLHGFLAALPGVESDFKAEWGWTRYKVGGRMFAAVCQNERGEDYLLTLKADPVEAELQRAAFWRVFPGYYCTKHCWNSVYLGDPGADWEEVTSRIRDAASDAEGELPEALLRDMCSRAHALTVAKLPRRLRPDREA